MWDVERTIADPVFEDVVLSGIEGASEEVVDYRFWRVSAVSTFVRW